MKGSLRNVTLGELESENHGVIQTGPFGSQLHMSDYSNEGTPVVMPTNIRDMRIDSTGIARVPIEQVNRLSRHKLLVGDIVYSRRGDVEKCALVTVSEAGWLCGTGCLLVRVAGETVDPRYLAYALSLSETREWIVRHAVGATMRNLNTSVLREVPLRIPSIATQRAIAETLGALDDKIESNRQAMALNDELLRAVFESRFDMTMDPDGVQIGEILDVNPKRKLQDGDQHRYVGMSDLDDFSPVIREWTFRPSGSGARFKNGDVLMARISPSLENGKTAIVDFLGVNEVAWGSTEFIVVGPTESFTTAWAYCAIRSEPIRSFAIGAMTGSSGRQRFNAERLSSYRISAPNSESLREFNEFAAALLSTLTSLRDETGLLIELRDSLLPELLSGRIRVAEAAEQLSEMV